MPKLKGSKALREKFSKIGEFAKDNARVKTELAELQIMFDDNTAKLLHLKNLITEQTETICSLNEQIKFNNEEITSLNINLSDVEQQLKYIKNLKNKLAYNNAKGVYPSDVEGSSVSVTLKKRRQKKPSGSEISEITKKRRRTDTWNACMEIHGGVGGKIDSIVHGILDTVTAKCSAAFIAPKILELKEPVTKIIKESVLRKFCSTFYQSEDNVLRSLNIYYCSNVLGKNKYRSVRKANKRKNVPNVIPYLKLAKRIRDVDIGELIPIQGTLDINVHADEKGVGYYRNLRSYLPRLAEFYLRVNTGRDDKLLTFNCDNMNSPILFLFSVGGDEAPSAGTSFLVSFLNAGKRVCSSFDNFLIFGGNVKENGQIIRNYLKLLLLDIQFLEKTSFTITVDDKQFQIEFRLELLPNDMKMLAFLAGELTNSAYYFSTFANVNNDNCAKTYISYNTGEKTDWVPFTYEKRCHDAKQVEKKKNQLSQRNLDITSKYCRTQITNYIRNLQSRQEFDPLVGRYIDKALSEPLHLKNNVCKGMFVNVWNVVISVAQVPSTIKKFKEIPSTNLLPIFVQFVHNEMKSNKLSRKLKEHYNDGMDKTSEFTFRFRGEESRNYLENFPAMILMLIHAISTLPDEIDKLKWHKRLVVIFMESIYLRKLISYTVRVVDITKEDIIEMEDVAKKMFKLVCLNETVSPSLWTLCVMSPIHAKYLFEKIALGLGVNSMEGREQKHQKIKRYMENSTVVERWHFVFRHEFISCVYLRENKFDQKKYNKKFISYMPSQVSGHCVCGLPLLLDLCEICDGIEFGHIQEEL